MLILPERNIARGKILLPQKPCEWRQPSQRTSLYGVENTTKFRLRAFLSDGYIKWTGWFDSREDADEFLLSLISGRLIYERELWNLPTPAWHPDIGEGLSYDFANLTFLTISPGTNQNFPVPSDWTDQNNSIESIAGGGSGGCARGDQGIANIAAGAGGGGAYAKSSNVTLTPSANAVYNIGIGALGPSTSNGTAGGNSWIRIDGGSVAPTTTAQGVLAAGGQGGTGSGGAGGAGGAAASSLGTAATSSGGKGGDSAPTGATAGAGGGGGAAGLHGAGNAGGIGTNTSNGGTGGTGDNGFGGTGGDGTGSTAGNPGTEWDASHGSGGGGGGGLGAAGATIHRGGVGGAYGAGSGGSGSNTSGNVWVSNAGADAFQGMIVVSYTPPLIPNSLEMPTGFRKLVLIGY